MHPYWTATIHRLNAFRRANSGNVAITFALATLPLIGTVGFAVDYSHANSVKAAMQAALDSTALMLSRDAATLTSSDLQTKAKSYFDALFTRPEAKNVIHHRDLHHDRRIAGQSRWYCCRTNRLPRRHRLSEHQRQRLGDRGLGLVAPARRAGPR